MEPVELPLSNPPIIGYLHHAYALSIMSESDSYLPWLHSNYVQLFCSKDFADLICPLNFYLYQHFNNFPLLEIASFQRTIVDSVAKVGIIEFIKNSINNGYHVLCYIDEFYIKDTNSYRSQHYTHDLLISGYSDSHNYFIVSSYFHRQFGRAIVSFDDFQEAYYQTDFSLADHTKNIKLMRCNLNEDYELNYDLIIDSMRDFISRENSYKNSFFKNENRLAYGLDVYTYLINYFQLVLGGVARSDARLLHIIWEHKKCMVARIEYLYSNGIMIKESHYLNYKKLEQVTNSMRMKLLKYENNNSPRIIEQIIEQLKQLEIEEELLLTEMLDEIIKARSNLPERKWLVK